MEFKIIRFNCIKQIELIILKGIKGEFLPQVWWHDKESDRWARGTSLLHGLEFLTAREIQGTVTRNSPCNSTRFFYHCPVWLKLLPLTLLIFCCFFVCFFICIYGLVFMFSAYKFLTKDIRVFKCEILLKMLNNGHCQKRRNMIAILCLVNVFSELCFKDILRWNLYTGKRLIRSFPTTFLREAV